MSFEVRVRFEHGELIKAYTVNSIAQLVLFIWELLKSPNEWTTFEVVRLT